MDKSDWQGGQGETWAKEWRRTDRSFGIVTDRLLAQLRGLKFASAVDIGCGAGELSLAIARGHPDAQVLGLDISPQLVAAARQRADNLSNVSFAFADAAQWQPEQGHSPDLLISRHGVMFFDDPAAAFANLAKAAAPHAQLVFSCFRATKNNPFFTEVLRLLPEALPQGDPLAPGPFAFADNTYVTELLAGAGWDNIRFEPLDFPMVTGAGPDPIADAVDYFGKIGPAARAIAAMDDDAREVFTGRLTELAQRHCHEGIVSLPAAAWIVTAKKR